MTFSERRREALAQDSAPAAGHDPISLVIRRRIRPGREARYEALVSDVGRVLAQMPGFLGSGVVRPAPGQRDYTLIARFASASAAGTWENSAERAEWLRQLEEVVEEQVSFEKQPGMELWFSAPEAPPAPQPPRWKTAVLILCVLFPVSQALNFLLGPHLAAWPQLLRALLTTILVVILMTYVFMPWATRLAGPWLRR